MVDKAIMEGKIKLHQAIMEGKIKLHRSDVRVAPHHSCSKIAAHMPRSVFKCEASYASPWQRLRHLNEIFAKLTVSVAGARRDAREGRAKALVHCHSEVVSSAPSLQRHARM